MIHCRTYQELPFHPGASALRYPLPDQNPTTPVLYKWSDITYLEWARQKQTSAAKQPVELEFVVFTGLSKVAAAEDHGRKTNVAVDTFFEGFDVFGGLFIWRIT